jgi:hypothetical protein
MYMKTESEYIFTRLVKLYERQDGVVWTGLMWLRKGTSVEGSCEHGNEPSGSTKCWKILEQLRDWPLLKKDSAPQSWLIFKW